MDVIQCFKITFRVLCTDMKFYIRSKKKKCITYRVQIKDFLYFMGVNYEIILEFYSLLKTPPSL